MSANRTTSFKLQVMTSCYECTGTCTSSVNITFSLERNIFWELLPIIAYNFTTITSSWSASTSEMSWSTLSENQVTTVGGTYSGLGTVDTDYTYRQFWVSYHFNPQQIEADLKDLIMDQNYCSDSAFAAGTCNLDSASGALHPTTG